jgi:signal transduction histidine kinase
MLPACWIDSIVRGMVQIDLDMAALFSPEHSRKAMQSAIFRVMRLLSKLHMLSYTCKGSPLHGIMVGIELIQDSQLTAFQEEMAQSVALASRTLLDTVDHILDYSKISNLTRGQKKDRVKVDSMGHHVTDDLRNDDLVSVYLARLTEEVVESAISAHRRSRRPSTPDPDTRHAVSVTLDIEKRESWTTAMTPGTWVRLLSNILGKLRLWSLSRFHKLIFGLTGNGLKYTPSGVVSVKLSTNESPNTNNEPHGLTGVSLQVQDTGIGTSQDFLKTEM